MERERIKQVSFTGHKYIKITVPLTEANNLLLLETRPGWIIHVIVVSFFFM